MSNSYVEIKQRMAKLEFPEKIVLFAIMLAIGIAGFAFWGSILPFIVLTLKNTIKAGIMLAVILAGIGIVANKQTRFGLKIGYKILIKKTIGLIFRIDKIETMQAAYDDAVKDRKKLDDHIADLEGQKILVENKIADEKNKLMSTLEAMDSVKDSKVPIEQQNFKIWSIEAKGYDSNLAMMNPMNEDIEQGLTAFAKLAEVADFDLAEMKANINSLKSRNDVVNSMFKISKLLQSLNDADSQRLTLYLDMKDEVEKDIATKSGLIRRTLKDSEKIVSSFDTKTGVMSAEGRLLLDKYKSGELSNTTLKDTQTRQIFNKPNTKSKYINS